MRVRACPSLKLHCVCVLPGKDLCSLRAASTLLSTQKSRTVSTLLRRYQKAYQDYARALNSQFPQVKVKGEFFTPGELQMGLAQLLQFAFFGGLAISLVGRGLLPEPYAKFIEANQMAILGGCFACNMIAGNLLNTGAFEVTYNGHPVWSKIETGRFPQMDEMRTALTTVMQLAGQPADKAVSDMPSIDAHPDL